MANVLSVLHFSQATDGYCLPACAQMVLNYLGVVRSQAELALQLGTRANIGAPHSHLTRLKSLTIDVLYAAGDSITLLQLSACASSTTRVCSPFQQVFFQNLRRWQAWTKLNRLTTRSGRAP